VGYFCFLNQAVKEKFTLKKKDRLKSRKSIDTLFKEGQRFSVAPLRIFYQLNNDSLKFGAGVSTKNFKRAVDRNRIKRLIREAYRLQKNELEKMLCNQKKGMDLFFIYTDKEMPNYKQVFDKAGKAIKKITRIVNENNSPAA
jgi:ribonuclease P protein component